MSTEYFLTESSTCEFCESFYTYILFYLSGTQMKIWGGQKKQKQKMLLHLD